MFDIPGLEEGQLMLDALNGFLIYVSKKGKIQFVSKTVEEHIGLKQVSLEPQHVISNNVTSVGSDEPMQPAVELRNSKCCSNSNVTFKPSD